MDFIFAINISLLISLLKGFLECALRVLKVIFFAIVFVSLVGFVENGFKINGYLLSGGLDVYRRCNDLSFLLNEPNFPCRISSNFYSMSCPEV